MHRRILFHIMDMLFSLVRTFFADKADLALRRQMFLRMRELRDGSAAAEKGVTVRNLGSVRLASVSSQDCR